MRAISSVRFYSIESISSREKKPLNIWWTIRHSKKSKTRFLTSFCFSFISIAEWSCKIKANLKQNTNEKKPKNNTRNDAIRRRHFDVSYLTRIKQHEKSSMRWDNQPQFVQFHFLDAVSIFVSVSVCLNVRLSINSILLASLSFYCL